MHSRAALEDEHGLNRWISLPAFDMKVSFFFFFFLITMPSPFSIHSVRSKCHHCRKMHLSVVS